jgi:hypothetical protein
MYNVYLEIRPSKNKNKKFDAIFYVNDIQAKIIPFGAKNYFDYTTGTTDEQKRNYLNRHRSREDWETPITAGSLSRWLLWHTRDFEKNIKLFKKKFNLK